MDRDEGNGDDYGTEIVDDMDRDSEIENDDEGIKNAKRKNMKNLPLEDEKERIDRFEYEIEESVANFVDEISISHNIIPDSSDEEEDDLVLMERRMRKKRDDKLDVGTAFYTGFEFKEAVLEYALSKARNIVQERWDKTKLSYKCAMGERCKWRVYCSYDLTSQKWLVKTRYGYHSCTPNGKCKILKSPVIARLFLDRLRQKTDLMPEEIQALIKDKWKIVSTRNQCQRGRLLALKWLDKEYEEQFAHLRGYVQEILTSNPRSTAIVETVPNAAGQDVFNRFYVCFENLRKSWRGTCRKIIGLDGTFLKVAVKGILLTAVGHDPNNQIYPIAWAVVQAENADNWLWFIKQIKVDLGLENGDSYVIISDRSKGLKSAVKRELPNAEHRMCVKHIIENLKKKHANKDLIKPMIWHLAWSYSPTEYEENIKKLKDYNLALHDDVMKEEPKSWSRAFYKLGSFCEDVDNNATKSFNSTITKARSKALVPMLETIRRQAMVRVTKRMKKSSRWQGRYTEYVAKMLVSEKKNAEKCSTITLTRGLYEVSLFGNSYNVNLTRRTCSCCKWQITGIPCEHAYGAMIDAGLDAEDYVSDFFSTLMWQETYNTNIFAVRGPRFWIKCGCPLITAPPEAILPGRKKKKKQTKFPRIKGKHESPTKKKKKQIEKLRRVGRIIHCSKCGEAGHNATGCKKHPKKKLKIQETIEQATSSSQGQDTLFLTQLTQATSDYVLDI